jgi:hypothetical protein
VSVYTPFNASLNEQASAIVRRVVPHGQGNTFVNRCVIEVAARDEYRDQLSRLEARVAELERKVP